MVDGFDLETEGRDERAVSFNEDAGTTAEEDWGANSSQKTFGRARRETLRRYGLEREGEGRQEVMRRRWEAGKGLAKLTF